MKFKIVIIIMLLLGTISSYANLIERVYSENGKYYAEIVFYPNNSEKYHPDGQCKIFNTDTKEKVVDFGKPFPSKHFFVGNDGQTAIYVNRRNDSIYHFYRGVQNAAFSERQLVSKESWLKNLKSRSERLLYTNPDIRFHRDTIRYNELKERKLSCREGEIDTNEKNYKKYVYKLDADPKLVFADTHPYFSFHDTVFIITQELKVVSISISSGEYSISDFLILADYLINNYNEKKCEYDIYQFDGYSFPKLSNGQSLENYLEQKYPNWVLSQYSDWFGTMGIQENRFWLIGYIDILGNFTMDSEMSNDSANNKLEIIKELQGTKFSIPNYPIGIDKWQFIIYNSLYVVANDAEKQKLLKLDSAQAISIAAHFDSIAVPKNIEECFSSLDSILSIEEIAKIDSCQCEESLSEFHFGIGSWLRGYWGLWSGFTKLSDYFNSYGVFHADDMSGIIIASYYRYRHKLPIEFEKQVKEALDYWNNNEDYRKYLFTYFCALL